MKLWLTLLSFQLLNLLQVSLSQNACSRLPSVLNAHVSEQARKDVYQLGETILFTCDTGFTSDLPIKYVCSSEGWLTLRQESCYSSTASCEHPSAHGGLRINGLPENNSPIPPGHVLIFGCDDPDKRLNGSSVLICDRDGQWNQPVPSCEETCEMPDIPQILRLMTPVEGRRATKGQKLRFECNQRGKFLQGNAEIECLERGAWSDQLPRCGDKRLCSPPPPIQDGDIMRIKPEYQEGETVEYICANYYAMEGGPRLTCRNGRWTGRVRCIKPCTVTKEEMDRNNIQIIKDWITKIYSEHNDYITFKCKPGKRHDGRVEMCQRCIEGVIQFPTCV